MEAIRDVAGAAMKMSGGQSCGHLICQTFVLPFRQTTRECAINSLSAGSTPTVRAQGSVLGCVEGVRGPSELCKCEDMSPDVDEDQPLLGTSEHLPTGPSTVYGTLVAGLGAGYFGELQEGGSCSQGLGLGLGAVKDPGCSQGG